MKPVFTVISGKTKQELESKISAGYIPIGKLIQITVKGGQTYYLRNCIWHENKKGEENGKSNK